MPSFSRDFIRRLRERIFNDIIKLVWRERKSQNVMEKKKKIPKSCGARKQKKRDEKFETSKVEYEKFCVSSPWWGFVWLLRFNLYPWRHVAQLVYWRNKKTCQKGSMRRKNISIQCNTISEDDDRDEMWNRESHLRSTSPPTGDIDKAQPFNQQKPNLGSSEWYFLIEFANSLFNPAILN